MLTVRHGTVLCVLLGLSASCVFIPADEVARHTDADGDGVSAVDDCDDGDAAVSPNALELCNGIDDDCDGQVDEALFPDDDGDGFGGVVPDEGACFVGWVTTPGDCDDARADVFPGQFEMCNGRNDGCASAWAPTDELGSVTWTHDGVAADLSGFFAAGTTGDPAYPELPTEGVVSICRGESPYRVRLWSSDVVQLAIEGVAIPLPDDTDEDDALPVLSGASSVVEGPTVDLSGGGAVSLRDLVLTGGSATPSRPGGGLHLSSLTTATLSGLVVRGNTAGDGTEGGAGVYMGFVARAELDTTRVEDNTGGLGTWGGGMLLESVGLRVYDSTIRNNTSGEHGGGIAMVGGRLDVRDSHIDGNTGRRRGGGVYVGPSAQAFLVRTTVRDNWSGFGGGSAGDGRLSCFGDDDTLAEGGTPLWTGNFADTGGAVFAVFGVGAHSFAGCGASDNTAGESVPYPDFVDVVLLDTDRGEEQWYSIVGTSTFCDWNLGCRYDVVAGPG